ncbi:phosphoribosylformylglycinamidine synthase subunit PurS [Candidatus Liberibacter africanus]|uniref:phosphoribosylformylglycinamidine synthase subunit PurS n=1 Tax=Liberibacter africanus TaxID=34020 RepID=UPI0006416028|nr:phosphoribosylformylglycinamidine synthase subunit PurS [Candidatus Liberibacter africanus]QTP64429.1 phosphoribosylformylglycinamidine synthase subunit PurS [Candidatus Liberibacter africanus]
MKAKITVKLKKDVLDPQGKALKTALSNIEFHNIIQIRQGKIFDIELDEKHADVAKKELDSICKNLLANPVIEDYDIEIIQS